MKTKTENHYQDLKYFLILVILALIVLASYNWGYYSGERNATDIHTKNEIATRYFKYIGNPDNLQEQCTFDHVIYGYSTECNRAPETVNTQYQIEQRAKDLPQKTCYSWQEIEVVIFGQIQE